MEEPYGYLRNFPCLRVFELPFAFDQSNPNSMPLPSRAPPATFTNPGGDWQLAVLDVRESFQCFSQGLCTRGSLGRAGLGSWEGHVPDFDSSQSEALRITPQEMLFVRTSDGTGSAPAPNKSQLDQLQACVPALPKMFLERSKSRRFLWSARPSAMACIGTGHGLNRAFRPQSGHHVAGCLKISSGPKQYRLRTFPPPDAWRPLSPMRLPKSQSTRSEEWPPRPAPRACADDRIYRTLCLLETVQASWAGRASTLIRGFYRIAKFCFLGLAAHSCRTLPQSGKVLAETQGISSPQGLPHPTPPPRGLAHAGQLRGVEHRHFSIRRIYIYRGKEVKRSWP